MLTKYGHFVMVDNGAAEPEDERVPFDQILEAADYIRADEVILPDVLGNSGATISTTTNETWRVIPTRNRMVVPQGETVDEWFHCLKVIASRMSFRTIGVPKHLERFVSRKRIVNRLYMDGWSTTHDIHLLGVYDNPIYEVLYIRSYKDRLVRGIDTGAPIAYAQNGELLKDDSPHYSLDWHGESDIHTIASNIQRLVNACTEPVVSFG